MPTIRKSITFTDKLSDWMQARIVDGEYANESEYVRDLVRKDRDRSAKFRALNLAIQDGMNSGDSSKTVTQIMEQVEDKLQKKGGKL